MRRREQGLTVRVDFTSQLQTIRICQICVCGGYGEDDRVGFLDLLQHHLPDLALNIGGLVADRHLGQPGQIHQRQRQDTRREYAEADGLGRDPDILSRFCLGFPDDLFSNLVEIVELLARNMEEFSPFINVCSRIRSLEIAVAIYPIL